MKSVGARSSGCWLAGDRGGGREQGQEVAAADEHHLSGHLSHPNPRVPGVGPRGPASPVVPLDWEPLRWDTDFFGFPIGRG